MRKIDRLKKEALESCGFREHKMSRFEHGKTGRGRNRRTALSRCTTANCDGWVCVDTYPPLDGIEIGGSAVAMNCLIKKEED